MVILESLSFSYGNASHYELGLYLVQSNGSNSALSPVVYGDIALSIKIKYKIQIQNTLFAGVYIMERLEYLSEL